MTKIVINSDDSPGEPIFEVSSHEQDECFSFEVEATPEQISRWEQAQQAWVNAQAEMKAAYVVVKEAYEKAERERDALEFAEWKREAAEERAKEDARQLQLDEEIGPREWFIKLGQPNSSGSRKFTVHHADCHILGEHDEFGFRLAEVIAYVQKEGSPWSRDVKAACQTCAKEVKTVTYGCRCGEKFPTRKEMNQHVSLLNGGLTDKYGKREHIQVID